MDILIRVGGLVNKGDEAMVLTVKAELSRRLPEPRFHLLSESVAPGMEKFVGQEGFAVAASPTAGGSLRAARLLSWFVVHPVHGRRVLATPPLLTMRHLDAALSVMGRFDGVVDVSGYAYSDNWGPGWAYKAKPYVLRARELGIPYIFMPQAWGPFDKVENHAAFRDVCANARVLYARDEVSRAHVACLLGCPTSAVDACPDIAFRFRGALPGVGASILTGLGVRRGAEPLVAVTPSRRIYDRMEGTGLQNGHVRTLIGLCRALRSLGAAVVLIPHEIDPSPLGTTDDRLVSSMIAAAVGDPKVAALNEHVTSAEIKSVIGHVQLLLGSRFHTLVAAFSLRIPAVAIGWTHKYFELFRLMGMDEYVVGHEQLDVDEVARLARAALDQREDLRTRLESRVPEAERAVDACFDRVASVLAGST